VTPSCLISDFLGIISPFSSVFPRMKERFKTSGMHSFECILTKELCTRFGIKLLETDSDLDFLSKLSNSELETLVALMRNRVEKFG